LSRLASLGPGHAPSVGLGWRRELASALLAAPRSVDFVEIVAESCMKDGPARREALALAEIWRGKVVPHGIRLSLGSADGIDIEHVRRLGELARAVGAPMLTEHVAFTRGGPPGDGREIGHLTQLPLTATAVSVVVRNLAQARRRLPDVPFLLETPAWTLRWPDDEMDEGAFFYEIARATGCGLLLDLANIYANAQNSGVDPLALLRSYPLERTAMVHLAGGAWRDGFYVDTHAHRTPPEVFALLAELLKVTGPIPVLIERDENYPPFDELRGELETVRALLAAAAPRSAELSPPMARPVQAAASEVHALSLKQAQLATLLTLREPPTTTEPFDAAGVFRSRSILHHKRLDEARARTRLPMQPAGPPRRWAWAQKLLGR